MIVINYTNGDGYFTLNGNKYAQVYQAVALGNTNIAIYSVHDIRNQLISTTPFNEVQVNGVYPSSQDALVTILIPILYSRAALAGAGIDFITQEDVPSTIARTIQINESLLNTLDREGVLEYITAIGITIQKGQIIILETIEGVVTVLITVNITNPTEGQEVQENFTSTFDLEGTTDIFITNVNEGQEITDMILNIELQ